MINEINAGEDIIDELLIKHNISLRILSDYADDHMEKLLKAEDIFNHKEDKDKRLCLAIFHLLAGDHAIAICECFCERYNIDASLIGKRISDENVMFLLAAFIYNPSFFAMSQNLCGIIRSQLAFEAEERKKMQIDSEYTDTTVFIRAFGFRLLGDSRERKIA